MSYVEVSQQHTAVEKSAPEVAALFRSGGFEVDRVGDMNTWLKRHAVFITAIAGALYEKGCNATQLGADRKAIRRFIKAVREGWKQLDQRSIAAAPFALNFIMCQTPLWLSVGYWSRLLFAPHGELYFAAHVRHAPGEMVALAADVRTFTHAEQSPELDRLLNAIQQWPQVLQT